MDPEGTTARDPGARFQGDSESELGSKRGFLHCLPWSWPSARSPFSLARSCLIVGGINETGGAKGLPQGRLMTFDGGVFVPFK